MVPDRRILGTRTEEEVMRVIGSHVVDGHDVAVIELHEGDDSPFYELIVDGMRLDTERFSTPPTRDTIDAVVTSQVDGRAMARGRVDLTVDIGLSISERAAIAGGLSRLLADTYTLYLKTHNYHWNVTGPMFQTLHLMFEQQYTELALAVDLIAERIRALGVRAPGSYRQFGALSSVPEEDDEPDASEMIRRLVRGQETVVRTARSLFPLVDAAHDEPTADLLTQRMQVHEKAAWMLRSLLEE
jgi:starvation-inducible DNA-binding protein